MILCNFVLQAPHKMADKPLLYKEILRFYEMISPDFDMPEGVSVMHPYHNEDVWKVVNQFYKKYYKDNNHRIVLYGINPGRFGAGVTGVPFTDPVRLENDCGIQNQFDKRYELSSQFVYDVINAWGGVTDFYNHFYITALSPLGFLYDGKNLNYYDDKGLQEAATPFILECVQQQKKMLGDVEIAFCLGEGANYKYFSKLNEKFHLFEEIVSLPHPRWVMQYRRKRKDEFVQLYVSKLKKACNKYKK